MIPRPARSLLATTGLAVLGGCAVGAHKRVDGREFARLCDTAASTTRATTWIGRTGDRAYIEVWYGGAWWLGGCVDVCSVLLADLPVPVREAIQRGQDPTTLPKVALMPPPAPRKPEAAAAAGGK
jgi:hypothetical protein